MTAASKLVRVIRAKGYDPDCLAEALPDALFAGVHPGDRVVLKPNWVLEAHKERPDEWEHVITHPAVITAVISKVLVRLAGRGRISVIDGPQTDASFEKLIARYPVARWHAMAAGVELEVIDLRDVEQDSYNGIVVRRRALAGDPRGKLTVDLLGDESEFAGHTRSVRGYYGADYDRSETNRAHDGYHNLYSVSRTVLECDVFINLPKLKTHRKSGITACLKNLVGINTYKNYLPHHSEGGPSQRGDQFPSDNLNARVEGPLMGFLKLHVLRNPRVALALAPLNTLGRKLFGETRAVIRSGNWHGNDTIWRMILDLNKVLLYARADGAMQDAPRRYIGIVDAIAAGDGEGPLAPDRVDLGYLICGTNPVAIDTVCAAAMGFAPAKIPSIAKAFVARGRALCDFGPGDVDVELDGNVGSLDARFDSLMVPCRPHFGWKGHIEADRHAAAAAS